MKIALFEISTSHEECIYTQLKFLTDAGYSVSLVLHNALKKQVRAYAHLCEDIIFIEPVTSGFFLKLWQQMKLANLLKDYDVVVFNTASSSKIVRNLAVFLKPFKVTCIGLLHNGRKLNSSFTQRLISLKIKKYFVLSDQIADGIAPKKGLRIESFYLIFFLDFKTVDLDKNSEIWIGIPGRIDWKRRDYRILIDALKTNPSLTKLKFLILGRLDNNSSGGSKLWQAIQANDLEHYFIVFDEFISNEDFHTYLKNCDYIMPLLTKNEDYLNYKISGSFNLAYAHKKMLLCNSYFKTLIDLKENGHFFDTDGLATLLAKVHGNSLDPKKGYNDVKWTYQYQKEKYIDFVTNHGSKSH